MFWIPFGDRIVDFNVDDDNFYFNLIFLYDFFENVLYSFSGFWLARSSAVITARLPYPHTFTLDPRNFEVNVMVKPFSSSRNSNSDNFSPAIA